MLRGCALAVLLALGAAGPAHAQLFLGARPQPGLAVGPLFVTATVTPGLDPVIVEVLWTLNVPPDRSAENFEQPISLLWPGEVVPEPTLGAKDAELNRYVEARGFTVIEDGRVALFARSAYQLETDAPPERIGNGAAFVTFVRQGGALGLTDPATLIQVPWHPKMTNRAWLMNLKFRARGVLKPKPATWAEATFWGNRHRFELAFNDVRPRALFPMYFEHRDRVLRLTEDPSQLVMQFAEAERLKIDSISPGTATRRRHESLEQTEVISRFLDVSEGIVPQVLTVQFGYFSGLQSWAPILIPIVFFVLGNIVRPLVAGPGARLGRILVARFPVGPAASRERQIGVIFTREQLARIVPGQTTREQALAVTDVRPDEFEQLNAPDRRTLIYRGRRVVPRPSRRFGWFTRVDAWDVEEHEVEITLERDVARDVQARVRRSHLTDPTALARFTGDIPGPDGV
jgi:hypothetical protein